MTPRRVGLIAGATVGISVLAWLLFVGIPRWYGRTPAPQSTTLSSAGATGRIQTFAMNRLGFVQAGPDQTTFVRLAR